MRNTFKRKLLNLNGMWHEIESDVPEMCAAGRVLGDDSVRLQALDRSECFGEVVHRDRSLHGHPMALTHACGATSQFEASG